MPKARKQRLAADTIRTPQDLEQHLEGLMNFPRWHRDRAAEWIDLVTLGSGPAHNIPHFRTLEQECFLIEITNSTSVANPAIMLQLLKSVEEVNRHSQQRLGYPLLSLLFT